MRKKEFLWSWKHLFYLFLYVMVLCNGVLIIPSHITMYYESRWAWISFGVIGIWRYLWWLNHVTRSLIYRYVVFPKRRLRAQQLWETTWRPARLLFLMTTYHERQTTTEKVLQSLIEECHQIDVPVHLFVGIGADEDEVIINNFFDKASLRQLFQITLVRQKLPGKRYAIGETLRAMIDDGLKADDLVVLMDGDTYFESGCLHLCLPFFHLYPKLQALTTHEKTEVNGPLWIKKWLDMRFAQRDFTMQSYALSNKILTLTGRMSIFRGKHLCEPEFLKIVEQDHLHHWLWGQYRFLSGDDKSTWYYLLKEGAWMFYIPDAVMTTIEYIEGNALIRMKDNLRRWSGNTLRNGARAIALGPRTVGYFIWWCLIDQRCTIWTMLIGHMLILILTLTKGMGFIIAALTWIAFSRLCLSCMLFIHARRIDMSFPGLIYLNQLLTTITKIYILFRLPQQRWKNRGDQSLGYDAKSKIRHWMAIYLTAFYCLGCFILILGLLQYHLFPSWGDIKTLF